MKKISGDFGFTLVEILVSMTIFSLLMVSVMVIFVSGSDISAKIDIQRGMQENIKNIVETISEDIRKNGITICSAGGGTDCMSYNQGDKSIETEHLIVGNNHYYLGSKTITDAWIQTTDQSLCQGEPKLHCYLLKNGTSPLSNSQVSFSQMKFIVSLGEIPKVTLLFKIHPAYRKGVKSELIKANSMIFQTTISDRLIKNEI